MKGFHGSMSNMADANVIPVDLKEHQIASKRHHPPAGRITIGRIPLRQNGQRITGIEQSCDIVVGHLLISSFGCDEIADLCKITLAARRIANRHKSPSCLRMASLPRSSPRSNSASASASASRIWAISSEESFAVIKSAIPHWIFIQSSCGMAATVLSTSCAVIDLYLPQGAFVYKAKP